MIKPGFWYTPDGREISLFEMDDEHLNNAIAKFHGKGKTPVPERWKDLPPEYWVKVLETERARRDFIKKDVFHQITIVYRKHISPFYNFDFLDNFIVKKGSVFADGLRFTALVNGEWIKMDLRNNNPPVVCSYSSYKIDDSLIEKAISDIGCKIKEIQGKIDELRATSDMLVEAAARGGG
ncbi:MAG: hypothetical protein WCY37_04280 [Candidatus Dojkabacteria bacterium]